MAEKTLINGSIENKISILDRGLHYGDGLFETIPVQDGSLLCFEEHAERLISGCERLSIPFTNTDLLKVEANSLINGIDKAVIKIIITRGQGGRGYALPENTEPSRIISLYPFPQYSKENSEQGVNVRTCDYRYSHNPRLAGIKHLNRLEQIMARSEWDDYSIAEGVVLDHDENVIEGTMSNIFYVLDNVLYTPDLSNCGVEGIVRNKIVKLAPDINIQTKINKISHQSLLAADEIFLTNSVIGVWPIKMIDEKVFSVGKKTQQIQQLLLDNNCIPKL
jgi:4-amino-4-deoxychorismate lyase